MARPATALVPGRLVAAVVMGSPGAGWTRLCATSEYPTDEPLQRARYCPEEYNSTLYMTCMRELVSSESESHCSNALCFHGPQSVRGYKRCSISFGDGKAVKVACSTDADLDLRSTGLHVCSMLDGHLDCTCQANMLCISRTSDCSKQWTTDCIAMTWQS